MKRPRPKNPGIGTLHESGIGKFLLQNRRSADSRLEVATHREVSEIDRPRRVHLPDHPAPITH